MKTLFLFNLIAGAVLVLYGCSGEMFGSIKGSGETITEERQVGEFTEIESNGAIDVTVTCSTGKSTVHVTADSNLLGIVHTEVVGKTLRITTDRSYSSKNSIHVVIQAPKIDRADMSGSGDLKIHNDKTEALSILMSGSGDASLSGLQVNKLSVEVNGSSDISVDGNAELFSSLISGSGEIHAVSLNTKRSSVEINGSGDAQVRASDSLKAIVSGSGDIRYTGNPVIQQSVNGSGSIDKLP